MRFAFPVPAGRRCTAELRVSRRAALAVGDAVGARIARLLKAQAYVLLKSAPLPADIGAIEAARRGIVDEWFPHEAVHLPRIVYVNLRAEPPAHSTLPVER